jgi:DNA-binding HxlR family transcriptional regulator
MVVTETIDLLGRRWGPPVLDRLRSGPQRYTDLHDTVLLGPRRIPTKSLTETLRRLQRHGIIEHLHTIGADSYRLTDLGRELLEHLDTLATWAACNRDALRPTS